MDRKVRVGAVSYLNTKPLIYGFEQGMMKKEIELIYDYPARIAALLLNNEIDIGLVPVAIIPLLKESYIITDYCIGTEGEVGSVCLFSDVPIEQVTKVLLDYQSRTSVLLARFLLQKYWKINPELIEAREDFRNEIKGATAGLVIGDRAFEQRIVSPFVYDLGEAWKKYTGLPFVFAAWIANKPLLPEFIEQFKVANEYGLQHLNKVIEENKYDKYNMKTYYTQNIDFRLTDDKKQGMELFLQCIN